MSQEWFSKADVLRAFYYGLAIGALLVVVALAVFILGASMAQAKILPPTWSYADRYRLATLRDCPKRTKIVINHSSSIYGPFRSFCYWGRT